MQKRKLVIIKINNSAKLLLNLRKAKQKRAMCFQIYPGKS